MVGLVGTWADPAWCKETSWSWSDDRSSDQALRTERNEWRPEVHESERLDRAESKEVVGPMSLRRSPPLGEGEAQRYDGVVVPVPVPVPLGGLAVMLVRDEEACTGADRAEYGVGGVPGVQGEPGESSPHSAAGVTFRFSWGKVG